MNLAQYWWTGLTNPVLAFKKLPEKPAPQWGFWVVLIINVLVSLTTVTAQQLLGREPQMESVLTFLPTERYFQAEIFFLPVLRVCVWLLQAAIIHLGIRLAGQTSDMDRILLLGGLITLIVMPPLMLSDWVLLALDRFEVGLTAYTHGLVGLWGMILMVIGLMKLLKIRPGLAIVVALVSELTTLPLLMIFAR